MIEWLVITSGAVALSAGLNVSRRSRAHQRWREVFGEAAAALQARVSTGSILTPPELRAEVAGVTVTVRLQGAHLGLDETRLEADARIPGDRMHRLYVGWERGLAPNDLLHVPEVHLPRTQRLEGLVALRAENISALDQFLERHMNDLLDIRREAAGEAVEIIARGGYLQIVLHGALDTSYLVQRVVLTTARFARFFSPEVPPFPASTSPGTSS